MTGSRVVRGRPGRVHEDSGGDRRDAREEDAGRVAQGAEAADATGSPWSQPRFCTLRDQSLFLRC